MHKVGGSSKHTRSLSSYSWGTDLRLRMFLYMSGAVKEGSSSSLWPLYSDKGWCRRDGGTNSPATVHHKVDHNVLHKISHEDGGFGSQFGTLRKWLR